MDKKRETIRLRNDIKIKCDYIKHFCLDNICVDVIICPQIRILLDLWFKEDNGNNKFNKIFINLFFETFSDKIKLFCLTMTLSWRNVSFVKSSGFLGLKKFNRHEWKNVSLKKKKKQVQKL